MLMHEQVKSRIGKKYLFSHEEKNLFKDKLLKSNEIEQHSTIRDTDVYLLIG